MKKFCDPLREYATKTIIFLKNEFINDRAAEIILKYRNLLYL